MPLTVNGFGTTYYGEADRCPDGSFITTEWAVAAMVPIFPLKSLRLARVSGRDENYVVYHSQAFAILETLPICWPQVFRIYLATLCIGAWWLAVGWYFIGKLQMFERSDAAWLGFLLIALMAIPFGLVLWFRKKARSAQAPPPQPPPLAPGT